MLNLVESKTINAAQIRMARAALNLTIRELAELSGVNKATVVKIEAGLNVRSSTREAVTATLEAYGAGFFECSMSGRVVVALDESMETALKA